MIITISGQPASGKSSVAKLLAGKLGYRHYSAGDMQREVANGMNLTITELNVLEQKDDSVDRKIDAKTKELGQRQDNFVIDGWLACCFIPKSFKVFLECAEDARVRRRLAHRRAEETLTRYNEALSDMRKRESANRERWRRYYSYDFLDMKNYDLVVDTTHLTIQQVAQKILDAAKRF